MTVQTRSQRDYAQAIALVTAVKGEDPKVQKIYGGLCHTFPIMVRTAGLAQTAAFHEAKANGNDAHRVRAHTLILTHMAAVLGEDSLPEYARAATTTTYDYMVATQRVLTAAVFFKNLAVSLLKVLTGSDTDGPDDQ